MRSWQYLRCWPDACQPSPVFRFRTVGVNINIKFLGLRSSGSDTARRGQKRLRRFSFARRVRAEDYPARYHLSNVCRSTSSLIKNTRDEYYSSHLCERPRRRWV